MFNFVRSRQCIVIDSSSTVNTRRAYPADGVAARRAHVCQPQDASLEFQVREQVRQAKVLVGVLAAEHL
jgi:hypothetical protein